MMQVPYTYDAKPVHSKEHCGMCCRGVRRRTRRLCGSVVTLAKIVLVFLNIWVLAVVLVVSLGQWRVFETNDFDVNYDNSHLIVMRGIKEEDTKIVPMAVDNSSAQQHNNIQAATAPPTVPPLVANIRDWCQKHHPIDVAPEKIPKSKLTSVMVDQKHKFLFCAIPGVALNDWRKILLISNGVVNTTKLTSLTGGDVFGKYSDSVKRLSSFGDKERANMLKNYYKAVFVRDPLERLVFAYNSKLKSKFSTYFHKAYGIPIIKKYRKNPSRNDLKNGDNVKFSEFVQFIIDTEHRSEAPLNEHWQQYYKLCHPCIVNYDYIGTFEHLEQETENVLGIVGAKSKIDPPYVTDTKAIPEEELYEVYKTVPARDLNNLFKVYSPDYTLFGYKCPNFLHELMKDQNEFHDY